MNGVGYRLNEFLPGAGRSAVLLDASAGVSLGPVPGLEDFGAAVRPVLPHLDGLVCSPGQLRRNRNRTRADSALLVRMDWTNVLRGKSFPWVTETPAYVSILGAGDALELGASAMVLSFLLGYDEAIEAACLKSAVQLAMAGKDLGMPLIVEVCPGGPRVSLPDQSVELGASFALESGADVVIIPQVGPVVLDHIAAMLSVPWLIKPTSPETFLTDWTSVQNLGAAGVWLDYTWLGSGVALQSLAEQLRRVPAGVS